MEVKICPRCGGPVSWFERKRIKSGKGYRYYLIAVHKDEKGRRKCYLGPAEGYVFGSITHSDLGGLEGLGNVWDRNKYYLENLIESFTKCQDPKTVKEVIEIIKSSLPKLETHLHTLKSTEVTEVTSKFKNTFKPTITLVNTYNDGSKEFLLTIKEEHLKTLVEMFNKLANNLGVKLTETPSITLYKLYCLEKPLEKTPSLTSPIAYISVKKDGQTLHTHITTTEFSVRNNYEEHIIKLLKNYANTVGAEVKLS